MPATARRLLPRIDAARCTGCGRCIATCHVHVLTFETRHRKKSAVLTDAGTCSGCTKCAVACPFDAIAMHRDTAADAAPG